MHAYSLVAVFLPPVAEQKEWEEKPLALKGDSAAFHAIVPDFGPYWNRLREIAGKPPPESGGYELPEWRQEWADTALAILVQKEKWWNEQIQHAKVRL